MALAAAALLLGSGGSLGADQPRMVTFGGYPWEVKHSLRPVGPGPNRFSASPRNVSADDRGLHLKAAEWKGRWYAAEVILAEPLGYGDYLFWSERRAESWTADTVGGAFLYDPQAPPYFREMDVEISRWSGETPDTNTQFVVQPHDCPDNRYRFFLSPGKATFLIRWSPEQVVFFAGPGHLSREELLQAPEGESWGREDPPEPGDARFRFNLYFYQGRTPEDPNRSAEWRIPRFAFFPPGRD